MQAKHTMVSMLSRCMASWTTILMIAVVLVAGASALVPREADALRVGLGGDTHMRQCRSLQDQALSLVAEYGRATTSNARRSEILNELRIIGLDWKAIGCTSRFGSIAFVSWRPEIYNAAMNYAPPIIVAVAR